MDKKEGFIKCELRENSRHLGATIKVGTQEINAVVPVRYGLTQGPLGPTLSNDDDIKQFLKDMFSDLVDHCEISLEYKK